jgi:hypothetical protein
VRWNSAILCGGWFGPAHRAPTVVPDPTLWPPADFDALVVAFRTTGFRPGNAWYLNDTNNMACAHTAPDGGRAGRPVLFVNGDFDGLCDISNGRIGEPMRRACRSYYRSNFRQPGISVGHNGSVEGESRGAFGLG